MFLEKNDRVFTALEWLEICDTLHAHMETGESPRDLEYWELATKIETEVTHASSHDNPTMVLTQDQANLIDFYAEKIGLTEGKQCRD